ADQYRHPHESKHTIGEALGWFDACGLEFVRGIPSVLASGDDGDGDLFRPTPRGSALDHFLVQAKQVVTGSREGGFFIMIGRKPHGSSMPESANVRMMGHGVDRHQLETVAH